MGGGATRNMQSSFQIWINCEKLRSLMSQRACCHTCYAIQLMHYSHFKRHSLQNLKPIKCENVFVTIKPLHVSVFFLDHTQGVLRCALCRYYSSRWFAWQICWWSACELCSQADHQQTRRPNTHRWHTHTATYCVIIQTQRTQISGRNSNGAKHSGGPLRMVEKKDRNM